MALGQRGRQREGAMRVRCPSCHAQPGQPCTVLQTPLYAEERNPHVSRLAAGTLAPPPCGERVRCDNLSQPFDVRYIDCQEVAGHRGNHRWTLSLSWPRVTTPAQPALDPEVKTSASESSP